MSTNPILRKAVTATACIAVCSLLIMGFAVPKHVTVIVDDSLTVTETEYETTAKRVDSFLDAHEIDFQWNHDLIDVDYYEGITDDMVKDAETIDKIMPNTVNINTTLLSFIPFFIK